VVSVRERDRYASVAVSLTALLPPRRFTYVGETLAAASFEHALRDVPIARYKVWVTVSAGGCACGKVPLSEVPLLVARLEAIVERHTVPLDGRGSP
jgi:hypothetical protein